MGTRIYLNDDWKFTPEYKEELLQASFAADALESVRLPHAGKETPLHYFDESSYQMVSGYRRSFFAPEAWREKSIFLTLDGAAHDSEVYLNGKKIGEHHCGYTAFTMELGDVLAYGQENILVVKVDSRETLNIPPFGYVIDYMTYAGIYRDVYLTVKEKTYLEDVFLTSELTTLTQKDGKPAYGSGTLKTEAVIRGSKKGDVIRQSMRKKQGYGSDGQLLGEVSVTAEQMTLSFPVKEVMLWNIECPALYEIKTELLRDGETVEEEVTTFGFRKAVFLEDGFYLNDVKTKIRGLNRHQSYPYVGYAMPSSMQRMDANVLKEELGVNAVRTSHYPQSQAFISRCDEIGLLVFTEIPGWQHIGDEKWKKQAVENVRDMVMQYRNHPSIILWGVRINESGDDDAFYEQTNRVAHELDQSRQTGGVRAHKKSSLLEDVYTYNDFSHDGKTKGCEKKAAVTSDEKKPYLISEYNGHMYPTKAYDWEEHRVWHAIRHANVLDAVAGESDIAGSFGWCMFDYNTHKDFGSGDRICYHGVMDMFRNPKLAAVIYACQQEERPVLEISSSMDIGEHPGCNRGTTWIFTNADSVRMYKNDRFIKEYQREESTYQNLAHGPIMIDDFIGNALEEEENMKPAQAAYVKKILNTTARYGLSNLPKSVYLMAAKLVLWYHMKPSDAVPLYNRYIGDWGGTSTVYRFEAVKGGKVVKTIVKEPVTSIRLDVITDHTVLQEEHTYDVTAVRFRAIDQNGNVLPFCQEPLQLKAEGAIALIGESVVGLSGGMGGTYVKTLGSEGEGTLTITSPQFGTQTVSFQIKKK